MRLVGWLGRDLYICGERARKEFSIELAKGNILMFQVVGLSIRASTDQDLIFIDNIHRTG